MNYGTEVTRLLRATEKNFRPVVMTVCAYEALALALPGKRYYRYCPPLSVIMNKHKWVFPVLCIGLGVHVWWLE